MYRLIFVRDRVVESILKIQVESILELATAAHRHISVVSVAGTMESIKNVAFIGASFKIFFIFQ